MRTAAVIFGVLFALCSTTASAYTIKFLDYNYVAIGNNGANWAYEGSDRSATDAQNRVTDYCPNCITSGGSDCCATALSNSHRGIFDYATGCGSTQSSARRAARDTCEDIHGYQCWITGMVCTWEHRNDDDDDGYIRPRPQPRPRPVPTPTYGTKTIRVGIGWRGRSACLGYIGTRITVEGDMRVVVNNAVFRFGSCTLYY